MKLWMSSEQMHECSDNQKIQREIVPEVNQLIENCKLGNYKEWAVITIILNEKGPDYKEIIRRSLKNMELEFRLKIDYQAFIDADYDGKKRLVLELLLRSLDIMEKWKDIKLSEREEIKKIIMIKYEDILKL